MPQRKSASHRRRATLGISDTKNWRGDPEQPLSPLDPYTMTLLAESGHLDSLLNYDLARHGARPLWYAILCHLDPEGFAAIPEAHLEARATEFGRTWTMTDLRRAAKWLNEQADQINASMTETEDSGEPGKRATSQTG